MIFPITCPKNNKKNTFSCLKGGIKNKQINKTAKEMIQIHIRENVALLT